MNEVNELSEKGREYLRLFLAPRVQREDQEQLEALWSAMTVEEQRAVTAAIERDA